MFHGSTTIAAGSTVRGIGIRQSRDGVLGRALAFNYINAINSIGDLWAEERFCNFYEETLQGTDKPTDGKIYVMYHGTTSSIAESIIKNEFRQSEDGMLGRGVYVSRDISKALRYPLFNKADQVVLKLRVNVGKVIKIASKHHPLKKTWHQYGYDTAWVPPNCGMINSGLEEDCVWDPQRIKVVEHIKPSPRSCSKVGADQPTDGRIYVMYHGTTSSYAESIIKQGFSQSADGMLGRGVYVSRARDKALRYPLGDKSDQVVLKLRVNVGNVIKIDRQRHPMQKTWHDHGYDTAWVPPYCGMVKSDLEEDCVWDPQRIKVVGITCATNPYVQQYLQKLVQQYATSMDFWAEERAPSFREQNLISDEKPTDGRIYVMYHGTTSTSADNIMRNGFSQSKDGMLGRGVYISRDLRKAKRYPLNDKSDQVILKLRVNVGRVKKINRQGHRLQKTWHDEGYDTAWVPPNCGMVPSGLEEDCVWDPKRIKVVKKIVTNDSTEPQVEPYFCRLV
ncbi:uncharacterized protein LOC120915857 [Rana temporaria]|uniref:uncharacterized protein LOC120915857 n=1 Tax=Rana temporaria TaxID=8407 RepID=UPI001AAD92D9|nr:uncharacterized protein LOC120915857 [Rana temporaria]